MTRPIQIGLLGVGTVGGGIARLLAQKSAALAAETGRGIVLRRALVRDAGRSRSVGLPAGILTTDPAAVVDDPERDVVGEVMGGISPARDCVEGGSSSGEAVVTANQELGATHGGE